MTMPAPLSHLLIIIFLAFCNWISSLSAASWCVGKLHLAGFLFNGSVSSDLTAPKKFLVG